MNHSPFIITRFTHGSAGKFLSTLLQTSDSVDHWSETIQKNKTNRVLTHGITLEYVRRSFPENHSLHLRNEPMVPYNTELYSAGFERGNNVSYEDYINYAVVNNDTRCLGSIKNNLFLNIIFHKPIIPNFCHGAKVITILTTSEYEQTWVKRALQQKHFLETEDSILYIPNSPMHCNFSSLPVVLQYQNKFKFSKSEKQLLIDTINSSYKNRDWYTNSNRFSEFDKSLNLDNQFIDLSDILNIEKLIPKLSFIFNYFKLGKIDEKLIRDMHKIYSKHHETFR
jgi:hypothetical protein